MAPEADHGASTRQPKPVRAPPRGASDNCGGEVTRTGPALQLSGTRLVHLGPAHPRGRDTVEGIEPSGPLLPQKPRRSTASWVLEQARWAQFLALGW